MKVASALRKLIASEVIQLLIFIFIFLIFCIIRSPEITLHGRFFAEEGSYFWANSLARPWNEEFFYVGAGTGYYLMNATLLTAISSHLTIQFAPLLTVWISIFFMVLPSIIYVMCTLEKNILKKYSVALLFAYSPPALSAEVFANSINSQIYLGVCTYVILLVFATVDSREKKILLLIILSIASLNGLYSVVLLPIAVFNFLGRGRKENFAPALVLFFGCTIQGTVFLNEYFTRNVLDSRFANTFSLKGSIHDLKELFRISFEGEVGLSKLLVMALLISIATLVLIISIITKAHDDSQKLKDVVYKRFFYLTILTFLVEYVLVSQGRVENIITGRYSVFLGILIFLGIEFYCLSKLREDRRFGMFLVLPIFVFLSMLFTVTKNDSTYLVCSSPCVSWSIQSEEFSKGQRSVLIHWPFGIGYVTDMDRPRETLRVTD
jgi:hypothetical protein